MKAERMASEPVLGQQVSPSPAGDVFLRMTDISKSYPGVQALADANFEVRRGEIHGLVGKNGAGKSTLMGVLMGISEPDSGAIEIDGHAVTDLTPDAMLQGGIAYVPQQIKLL